MPPPLPSRDSLGTSVAACLWNPNDARFDNQAYRQQLNTTPTERLSHVDFLKRTRPSASHTSNASSSASYKRDHRVDSQSPVTVSSSQGPRYTSKERLEYPAPKAFSYIDMTDDEVTVHDCSAVTAQMKKLEAKLELRMSAMRNDAKKYDQLSELITMLRREVLLTKNDVQHMRVAMDELKNQVKRLASKDAYASPSESPSTSSSTSTAKGVVANDQEQSTVKEKVEIMADKVFELNNVVAVLMDRFQVRTLC